MSKKSVLSLISSVFLLSTFPAFGMEQIEKDPKARKTPPPIPSRRAIAGRGAAKNKPAPSRSLDANLEKRLRTTQQNTQAVKETSEIDISADVLSKLFISAGSTKEPVYIDEARKIKGNIKISSTTLAYLKRVVSSEYCNAYLSYLQNDGGPSFSELKRLIHGSALVSLDISPDIIAYKKNVSIPNHDGPTAKKAKEKNKNASCTMYDYGLKINNEDLKCPVKESDDKWMTPTFLISITKE